jgi:hypothetical protein
MKKRLLASVAVLALVASMSACSSSSSSDTTTPAAESTIDSTAKVAGPTEITVTVGVDSSPDRTVEVSLGAEVNVRLSNPDADDNFHLHGYDLSPGDTPKGEVAVITFTADTAGVFEIESHVTDTVLINISVK